MIKSAVLGTTEISVPTFGIGTGTLGFIGSSQQSQISANKYADILSQAYYAGFYFWDTSDDYGIYPHIREALSRAPRSKIVLSTKSHANTKEKMRKNILQSLQELSTDYIDIFFMHEIDSINELRKRMPALLELHNLKNEGLIRSIGISTHAYPVLSEIAQMPAVEVILTNFNKFEDHMDASIEAYSKALQTAHNNGKGVIVMKALGEGRLVKHYNETLQYNISRPFIHSTVIGITKQTEILQLLEFCRLNLIEQQT